MANTFKKVPVDVLITELTPLNISCGSTKCEENLHCFQRSQKVLKKFGEEGVCKECGANLIDWNRIYRNDINDSKFIFQSMKYELIRHVYWHTPIKETAIKKAIKKGKQYLILHSRKILKASIGNANNFREGYQTPKFGSEIVNYAQHATATCCRKCLEYWHGIKIGFELTEKQLDFCTELVMQYIEERIPEINKDVNKIINTELELR